MSRFVLTCDGTVVYDSGATPPEPRLPPKPLPDSANPFFGFKASGAGLYDIVAQWQRYLTPAEIAQAEAAGYTIPDGIRFPAGQSTLTPDGFDPYRTALTAEDAGKVFKARPGKTHYTFAGVTDWRTVLDGLMHVDARCSVSIDGAPWMDVTGASSKVGRGSTLDIDCDYEWSVQVGG